MKQKKLLETSYLPPSCTTIRITSKLAKAWKAPTSSALEHHQGTFRGLLNQFRPGQMRLNVWLCWREVEVYYSKGWVGLIIGSSRPTWGFAATAPVDIGQASSAICPCLHKGP